MVSVVVRSHSTAQVFGVGSPLVFGTRKHRRPSRICYRRPVCWKVSLQATDTSTLKRKKTFEALKRGCYFRTKETVSRTSTPPHHPHTCTIFRPKSLSFHPSATSSTFSCPPHPACSSLSCSPAKHGNFACVKFETHTEKQFGKNAAWLNHGPGLILRPNVSRLNVLRKIVPLLWDGTCRSSPRLSGKNRCRDSPSKEANFRIHRN